MEKVIIEHMRERERERERGRRLRENEKKWKILRFRGIESRDERERGRR